MFSEDDVNDTGQVPPGGSSEGSRHESSSADAGRSDARARVADRPGGGTAGPSRDESSTARAGPSDARAQVADRPGGGAVAVDEDMEIEEELSTGRVLGENYHYLCHAFNINIQDDLFQVNIKDFLKDVA